LKPQKTIRTKNISVCLWNVNSKSTKYSIGKGYKNDNGEWNNEYIYINDRELDILIDLLKKIKGDKK